MNRTDLHNHLLPDVDDGSRSMAETRRYLELFATDGVADIVLTPHLLVPSLKGVSIAATLQLHRRRFGRLRQGLTERPDLPRLHLGQEILAPRPEHLLRALASDPDIGLAGGPWLLVELGFGPGSAALSVIDTAHRNDYRIVLAHVERCWFTRVDHALRALADWRAAGAWLQVNGGSLLGAYGAMAETLGWQAVAGGLASLVATDHHGDARPHGMGLVEELLLRRVGPDRTRQLLEERPRRVLAAALEPEGRAQPATGPAIPA